jgi:hypothetical protein
MLAWKKAGCGGMREIFVAELIKEVLGPRSGVRELLHENPLNEYITGVLAPIVRKVSREVDAEAEIPAEGVPGMGEEEAEDVDVNVPPLFSPVLDPKRRPSTMGISFVLESTDTPQIDVCLTWARYFKIEENGWERKPRSAVLRINAESGSTFWIDGTGRVVDPDSAEAEVSLHVISRRRSVNQFFITLYLVNRVKSSNPENPDAREHIFQPQIRVVCAEGTRIVPGIRDVAMRGLGDETTELAGPGEDEMLEFLYRHRRVLARGHLCSAIWKEIDPEIPSEQLPSLDFPSCLQDAPFKWLDGELLPEADRERFSKADVRTEFVPIYSVPAPDLSWRDEYGTRPELSCEKLAEMWDPDRLRSALSPIVVAYSRWIDDLRKQLPAISGENPRYRQIAEKIIQTCQVVRDRISAGIDMLCNDEEARLAFCFANKAMDLQSRWSPRRTGLTWHPFQLAFILMTLESVANSRSPYRDTCDLLWVPTGAGKTEAYLAIMIFALAYRRRRAMTQERFERTGAGVAVITRYTLRLLTIQQFRRILAAVTACECLRVFNLSNLKRIGWRPKDCKKEDNFLWGSTPFSVGLWVGGNVTPNRLKDTWGGNQTLCGAISILKGQRGEGEPAQVLTCPACGSLLAVPEMGLKPGTHELYLVLRVGNRNSISLLGQLLTGQTFQNVRILNAVVAMHDSPNYCTLGLRIETQSTLKAEDVDNIWKVIEEYLRTNGCKVELIPARASRMGYFLRYYEERKGTKILYDFEIFCPNPECELRQPWVGGASMGWVHGMVPNPFDAPDHVSGILLPDGNKLFHIQEPFIKNNPHISDRIPIPAMTVDDQIYSRVPSIIVATIDKFARMPFEPRIASLFGNVRFHHVVYGYYRPFQHSADGSTRQGHPIPAGKRSAPLFKEVKPLSPPDIIIQDELHLIEGPLGSLAGFYESAIEFLIRGKDEHSPKYIASTATIRRAEDQVKAVFLRGLQIFPPYGLTADDRFFITEGERHPLDDGPPGRLYVGICAPGWGPHTPTIRIWSKLMQTAWMHRTHPAIDDYWTLTGYFNAIRELAGALALYRQDIPQRIVSISQGNPRQLSDERALELSSRTSSTDLPSILDLLIASYPRAPDALFTTSMFGTGVDIPRLALMVVHGQPKTTSAYIQSTGRVGRRRGALVVIFFRASRPRDLSHYESFCRYHRQLHRFVEPITVYPFAPGVLDRAGGPVAVAILRNMRDAREAWHKDDSATLMATKRQAPEVRQLPYWLESRAQSQPLFRRPPAGAVRQHLDRELDAWHSYARNFGNLKYVEYAITRPPQHPVVLGDAQHQHANLPVVYENAPQSLRDIEETTGFQTLG